MAARDGARALRGGQNRSQVVARSARISGLANGAAGHCSSYGSADSYGARGARQRSGGVEKYSSIASRQAPEHGSAPSSPGDQRRDLLGAVDADPGAEHPAARAVAIRLVRRQSEALAHHASTRAAARRAVNLLNRQ